MVLCSWVSVPLVSLMRVPKPKKAQARRRLSSQVFSINTKGMYVPATFSRLSLRNIKAASRVKETLVGLHGAACWVRVKCSFPMEKRKLLDRPETTTDVCVRGGGGGGGNALT